MDGPPMSMFSMISGSVTPGLAAVLLKGIEIDDDEVDGLDRVGLDGGDVLGIERMCRMPPWTLGCSVLTRPSSISGKPGQVGDVTYRETGLAQGAGGAAGRDQLDCVLMQGAGKVDDAGLVGDGKKGAADRLAVGGGINVGVSNALDGHTMSLALPGLWEMSLAYDQDLVVRRSSRRVRSARSAPAVEVCRRVLPGRWDLGGAVERPARVSRRAVSSKDRRVPS